MHLTSDLESLFVSRTKKTSYAAQNVKYMTLEKQSVTVMWETSLLHIFYLGITVPAMGNLRMTLIIHGL